LNAHWILWPFDNIAFSFFARVCWLVIYLARRRGCYSRPSIRVWVARISQARPDASKEAESNVSNRPKDQGHSNYLNRLAAGIFTGDNKNDVVKGYLMPRVSGGYPIMTFYDVNLRHKECPSFHTNHCVGRRSIVTGGGGPARQPYLIGDVNDQNILVYKNALVT